MPKENAWVCMTFVADNSWIKESAAKALLIDRKVINKLCD